MIVFWGGIRRFYVIVVGGFFQAFTDNRARRLQCYTFLKIIFLAASERMLSLLSMPSFWGKNHRTSQVGRDLEKSSGPTFCGQRSLFSTLSSRVLKSLQWWGFYHTHGEVVSELPCFHCKKKSLYKDETSPGATFTCCSLSSKRGSLCGQSLHPLWSCLFPTEHREEVTPRGKRIASNPPEIVFSSFFKPESLKANTLIRVKDSVW